jgi:Ca2+-binding EF-hand superfamily protein
MKRIFVISALVAAIAIPSAVYAAKHSDKRGDDRIQHMFEKFDTNKDGVLTKTELPERMQRHFDKVDKDDNGSLTKDEVMLAQKERKEKRLTEVMMRFDTDSDGKVSEAEVVAFATEKFKKADKNGDGSLTKDEIMKMGTMMRSGGHHRGKHHDKHDDHDD